MSDNPELTAFAVVVDGEVASVMRFGPENVALLAALQSDPKIVPVPATTLEEMDADGNYFLWTFNGDEFTKTEA